MSRSGQLVLQKVIITYSPNVGRCSGVRQALAREVPLFSRKYPSVAIDIRPRKWPEPYLAGVYKDGSERTFSVNGLSAQAVWIRLHRLVSDANDYHLPFNGQTMHFSAQSVQGVWNPWLWSYERNEQGGRKAQLPRWDRPRLTEPEWNYYVDKYTTEKMSKEQVALQQAEDHGRTMLADNSKEVAERFATFVAPVMNTDLAHNVGVLKSQAAEAADDGLAFSPPQGASLGELRLFASPQHHQLGGDVVHALRRAEASKLEQWWAKRKESSKPPK